LYLVTLGKGIVHPKVKNYVMIYTHCFNPVWVSLFCWTQKKILKNVGDPTVDGTHWLP